VIVKFREDYVSPSHKSSSEIDLFGGIADPVGKDMWTLKPLVTGIVRQHEEMVYYLATLGEKGGYDVHIPSDEYGKKYQDKMLRELVRSKDIELSNSTPWVIRRISRIDVVWFKGERIFYSFDVEYSTNITDSIM